MKYLFHFGTLHCQDEDGEVLAHVKSSFYGAKRSILLSDGSSYYTDIQNTRSGRIYVLCHADGTICLSAAPHTEEEKAPSLCRLPRTDRAAVCFETENYLLSMHSSSLYRLTQESGEAALTIIHRGMAGGWELSAENQIYPPYFLCGIFFFCRYLEQENEFITV